MKLASESSLAQAALELAQATLPVVPFFEPYRKLSAEELTFELTRDGVVSIKAPSTGNRKVLTLSLKAHFATVPVLQVNAKDAKVLANGRRYPMSKRQLALPVYDVVASAKLKDYR